LVKVLFIGDTHGKWSILNQIIKYNADKVDVIIQLGDFGFWPSPKNIRKGTYGLGLIDTCGLPLYWVDGNHEHHDHLKPLLNINGTKDTINIYGDIHYIPRGCRFTLGNTSFIGCGGATSIDKCMRTPGVSWFKDEVSNYEEAHRIIENPIPTDVLLSHTVPFTALEYMKDTFKLQIHDPTNELLEEIVELFKIKKVYAGHWHHRLDIKTDRFHVNVLRNVECVDPNCINQDIYDNIVYKIEEFE
jgi:Icc-related predicted phosphoesterase